MAARDVPFETDDELLTEDRCGDVRWLTLNGPTARNAEEGIGAFLDKRRPNWLDR